MQALVGRKDDTFERFSVITKVTSRHRIKILRNLDMKLLTRLTLLMLAVDNDIINSAINAFKIWRGAVVAEDFRKWQDRNLSSILLAVGRSIKNYVASLLTFRLDTKF